jgi:protocatechuate 3,4-dioxygenase beta subunit
MSKKNAIERGASTAGAAVNRRATLRVLGAVGATALVGCGEDSKGGGTGGSGAAGTGGSGTAGSGGSGAAGRGGSGAAGSGAAGTGGSGGSSAGAGGSAAGSGGAGGSGAMADAGGAADFASDARIEMGSPPNMVDGATIACRRTTPDILGPYHLNNMPERATIAGANDGMILIVQGRLLNTRCQPLANVLIDVWQANGRGVYSEVAGGWGRGKVKTDADGHYRYETVYPGPYQGRPRHIHLLVEQPGYTKLVTQMYFQGERPDIAANAVPRTMVNGVMQSEFDIVLAGTGMASAPREQEPLIVKPGQFPRRFWVGWSARRA